MDKLLAYINSMDRDAQIAFATRCGTTVGYLRKAVSIGQKLSEGLCLRVAAESAGAVRPEDLRSDVQWPYMRQALANSAQAATENVAEQGAAHV